MSATKTVPSKVPGEPNLPVVDLSAHKAEKAWYKAELAKKQAALDDCLDPVEAKKYEDRKPLYEWKVSVEIRQHKSAKSDDEDFDLDEAPRWIWVPKSLTIKKAQDEGDAWAMFCDKIKSWPGKGLYRNRVIEKVKQVNK